MLGDGFHVAFGKVVERAVGSVLVHVGKMLIHLDGVVVEAFDG